MTAERRPQSLEQLEERQADLRVREEGEEEAALDRLIDLMVDRVPIEPELEAVEVMEREFMCRACHLIFSRSCLADHAWMLCADCAALAGAGPVPTGEVPHVRRAHHPCPACGALMMVPEREEVLVWVRLPLLSGSPHEARRSPSPRLEPS